MGMPGTASSHVHRHVPRSSGSFANSGGSSPFRPVPIHLNSSSRTNRLSPPAEQYGEGREARVIVNRPADLAGQSLRLMEDCHLARHAGHRDPGTVERSAAQVLAGMRSRVILGARGRFLKPRQKPVVTSAPVDRPRQETTTVVNSRSSLTRIRDRSAERAHAMPENLEKASITKKRRISIRVNIQAQEPLVIAGTNSPRGTLSGFSRARGARLSRHASGAKRRRPAQST